MSDSGDHSRNERKLEECTWENFSNWIHCICVVTFDLELGQALEVYRYFPCFIITEKECKF